MGGLIKRGAAIPWVLTALSFVLAIAQRPGVASSDTKIDLHTDPVGFLGAAAAPWTDAFGLGAVWSGQYSGYLWPMGPFFALGDAVALPQWLVHRLWIGALLALAAWGAVRLVDALHGPRRGIAHLVAGVAMIANPYVVIFLNRTSITLLALAALPWLLLAVHRGLRDPRGWWWPAAFALVLASAGGGVNAATTAWVLFAPAMLALYEAAVIGVRWRAVRGFAVRTVPLVALTSAWWVVPAAVQTLYGIDFLKFTEQPDVIWHTTSMSESLRGMGYWTAYTELDFGGRRVPFFSNARTLLFEPVVVVASLLLPAMAIAALAAARRSRYVPFLAGMALVGAFVMTAGFPEASPLRRVVTALYENATPVQFLRTTYKAGPLVVVGFALLLGLGADRVWSVVASRRRRVGLAVASGVVVVAASLPLFTGTAVDRDVTFDVPAETERAARELDRDLPTNTRALVMPGSLFGFYDWGGTTDPALPVLSDRPTAARFVVPYSDLRAIDLLWTVDGLVEERRTLPGQLPPLLALLGVGAVLAPYDYDAARAGSVAPADAARALTEGGVPAPDREYGRPQQRPASPSSMDGPLSLPRLRRHPTGLRDGLLQVLDAGPATIVDGSAQGVAGLAAFGQTDPDRPLLYAADQSPAELRRMAAEGAEVVMTDSNRRRTFVNSRIRANTGRTLDPGVDIPPGAAVLDPFDAGPDAQTVATYSGARWLRGTVDATFSQYPDRGPAAAFDGRPETPWLSNAFLRDDELPYIEVGFLGPRDVDTIELLPYADARGRPTEVEINGRRLPVRNGWNRLKLGLRDARSLRIAISDTEAPETGGGPGGLREVRVPGLRARERLRMPLTVPRALGGRDLRRSRLTVLAERTTAYSPLRLTPPSRRDLQSPDLRNRADAEQALDRELDLPAARRFTADAWVSPGLGTSDSTLDRMAGTDGPDRFESSARFESVPGRRASKAFDGDPGTAWVGARVPGRLPWLQWSGDRPRSFSTLRLTPGPATAARPTRVRLRSADGVTPALEVEPGGRVRLPRTLRTDRLRIEVLASAFPEPARGAPRAGGRRAVAIGEVVGGDVPRAPSASTARLRSRCSDAGVRIAGERVGLRARGTVAALDRGRPLRARGCRAVEAAAGPARLRGVAATPLRADLVRLDSPAPEPRSAATGGGEVLDPGRLGNGKLEGARVRTDGPAWVVLGEAYNRAWRANCDGRDLGEPRPIGGYANGWRVRSCSQVSFAFAGNGVTSIGYLISLICAAGLLGLLIVRRGRRRVQAADLSEAQDRTPRRLELPTAAAVGAVAAVAMGALFALRAGIVLGPLIGFALWRGASARTLATAAAGLLGIVVPAVYLLLLPDGTRGFDSSYALDLIAAHWVAVAAVVLAALAVVRGCWSVRAVSRQ